MSQIGLDSSGRRGLGSWLFRIGIKQEGAACPLRERLVYEFEISRGLSVLG